MNLGSVIKTKRKELGLTQNEFCELIGLSQSYLSQVERGIYQLESKSIDVICEKLNISKAFLLWNSLEESDVHESKRSAFRVLKPAVDELLKLGV